MRWNILLAFTLFCTMMSKAELIAENAIQIQTYSPMMEAANEEVEVEPELVQEPEKTYYGSCRITFYCPCSQCCGSWGNETASGVMPTAGRTVANGSLPFGTRVLIDGVEYVVEDRGVGSDQFDIFVNDHGEALARGLYYTDVFIID